jgi:hypothetical protein
VAGIAGAEKLILSSEPTLLIFIKCAISKQSNTTYFCMPKCWIKVQLVPKIFGLLRGHPGEKL